VVSRVIAKRIYRLAFLTVAWGVLGSLGYLRVFRGILGVLCGEKALVVKVSFALSGLDGFSLFTPGLAPGAAILRRFAACIR